MSKYVVFHEFGGITSTSPPFTTIALHFTCSPGTYTLGKTTPFFAYYGNVAGTLFTSRTGNLTITEIDTFPDNNQQFLKKFKCTFNFMTDTIGGETFNITNGMVDFVKP